MPPVIKLESIVGDQRVEILHADSGIISVGREPENGVVVDSESVSRRHCALFGVGNFWVFRDFGSTNGSWVNGVQVPQTATRLLRNGDKLQIADFPILLTEIGPDPNVPRVPPQALLIFNNDNFEGQFDFTPSQMRCVIGGPNANFQVYGENSPVAEIYVIRSSGRLEIAVARSRTVMVNGSVIGGAATLSDRDELVVGHYSILVADSGSALGSDAQRFKPGFDPNSREIRSMHAFAGGGFSGQSSESDWSSGPGARPRDTDPRTRDSGRRLILGSGGIDPGGTQVVPSQRFRHSGFEMNPSQRFTLGGVGNDEDSENRRGNPQMMIVSGAIVLLVLLGVIAFVFLS